MLDLTAHRQLVARSSGLRFQGRVVQVVGLSIEVEGLRLPLGEICHLYPERATAGASRITAEVVGFRHRGRGRPGRHCGVTIALSGPCRRPE